MSFTKPCIVALCGFIGAGKDTAAEYFVKHNFVKDSFAASLKDATSAIFGWPRHLLEGNTVESRVFRENTDVFWSKRLGIDSFSPRLALQLLGTDVMRNHFHSDIWLAGVERRVSLRDQPTVVSDARFANELSLVKDLNGPVVWVLRDEIPVWFDIGQAAARGDTSAVNELKVHYPRVHASEWSWLGSTPDYTIINTGSFVELESQVVKLINGWESQLA